MESEEMSLEEYLASLPPMIGYTPEPKGPRREKKGTGRAGNGSKGEVTQWTLSGELVAVHSNGSKAAASLGKKSCSCICDCIKGKQNQAHGFKWTRETK